jgi:hypothetical protein
VSTPKDGGPAFPIVGEDCVFSGGMTLLDYFASTATEEDIADLMPKTDAEREELEDEFQCPVNRQWARYEHALRMLDARAEASK